MKKEQIINAWRNPEAMQNLSAEERAQLPAHPAGLIDVDDHVLNSIAGGCGDPCPGGESAPTTNCFTCACTPQYC